MQVHYDEGLAIHIGPEPCVGVREDDGEASVGSWSMLPRCVLAHDKPGPTMTLALHRHHRARTTARKDLATTGSMMPPVAKPKHKLI